MRKSFLVAAAVGAASLAAPANAVVALKLEISNALGSYLQVPEVQAVTSGAVNVAASANGGVASAALPGTWNFASTPAGAIDGVIQSNFNFSPNPGDLTMYHPADSNPGHALIVTFAALSDITQINIWGRTDCCSERDLYAYRLLDASGAVVASGQLDARATNFASVSLASAVPEASTWAMMISGFGFIGAAMRRRKVATTVRFA